MSDERRLGRLPDMTNITLSVSDICSALPISKDVRPTIGTRVIPVQTSPLEPYDYRPFLEACYRAISAHDFSQDKIPGQGFIPCPEAIPYVSSGVGRKSSDASRYHCREHRGVVSAYLKREFAEPASACFLVVYTQEAYLKDLDVTPEEASRIVREGSSHVLVAVLGSAGPESPLPPYRLVWNLAGGNREALVWTADEIRAKAKAAIDYNNDWSTVAD